MQHWKQVTTTNYNYVNCINKLPTLITCKYHYHDQKNLTKYKTRLPCLLHNTLLYVNSNDKNSQLSLCIVHGLFFCYKNNNNYHKSVFSFLRRWKQDIARIAVDRHVSVDMGWKLAAPAADAPCSNRSMSPVLRARSSKPAACCGCGVRRDRRTDTVSLHIPCHILWEQCQ